MQHHNDNVNDNTLGLPGGFVPRQYSQLISSSGGSNGEVGGAPGSLSSHNHPYQRYNNQTPDAAVGTAYAQNVTPTIGTPASVNLSLIMNGSNAGAEATPIDLTEAYYRSRGMSHAPPAFMASNFCTVQQAQSMIHLPLQHSIPCLSGSMNHHLPLNEHRVGYVYRHYNQQLQPKMAQSTYCLPTASIEEALMKQKDETERLKQQISLLQQQTSTASVMSGASSKSHLTESFMSACQTQQSSQVTAEDLETLNLRERNMWRRERQEDQKKTGDCDEKNEKTKGLDRMLKFFGKASNHSQLLNKKEYEIQELQRKLAEKEATHQKDIANMQSMLIIKEEESLAKEKKCAETESENEKLKQTLARNNEYLESLPNRDEYNKLSEKIDQMNHENEILLAKKVELESKIVRAKQYVRDKLTEIKNHKAQIEEARVAMEKLQVDFDNYKRATQDAAMLFEKCKENEMALVERDSAKKMITTVQELSRQKQQKHDEEMEKIQAKLRMEHDLTDSLRTNIYENEKTMSKLQDSLKELAKDHQHQMAENVSLSEEISSLQALMSRDTVKNLEEVFDEITLCSKDLELLVKCCNDIYDGKEVDVERLLGYTDTYNGVQLKSEPRGSINDEYLLKKKVDIKSTRSMVHFLRRKVVDKYAELVGIKESANCTVQ